MNRRRNCYVVHRSFYYYGTPTHEIEAVYFNMEEAMSYVMERKALLDNMANLSHVYYHVETKELR